MEQDWGPVIYSYSRSQAIADGELVDISQFPNSHGQPIVQEAGFKYHMAMTRAAWAETIEAGGHWEPWPDGYKPSDGGTGSQLVLPSGQSISGRLWDVLWMLRCAIGRMPRNEDRTTFTVMVDTKGDGCHNTVRLWCLVGPGDTPEPVMTIMLQGED
jgi:hypothetical protein